MNIDLIRYMIDCLDHDKELIQKEKRINIYLSMKEEFDLEIAHSQVSKIIIELVHKYQVDDETKIKVKLAEIFSILTDAKIKNKNKGGK